MTKMLAMLVTMMMRWNAAPPRSAPQQALLGAMKVSMMSRVARTRCSDSPRVAAPVPVVRAAGNVSRECEPIAVGAFDLGHARRLGGVVLDHARERGEPPLDRRRARPIAVQLIRFAGDQVAAQGDLLVEQQFLDRPASRITSAVWLTSCTARTRLFSCRRKMTARIASNANGNKIICASVRGIARG
jgi:hypothetical protein